jgi:molybdate transport system substrate-binding protein
VLALGLLGCTATDARQGLEVFAASSLTDVFTALEPGFEARHPDVDLRLAFGGSQALRLQLEHGARAAVFASADARQVQALAAAGRVRRQAVLAENRLVLVTPPDDPAGIAGVEGLGRGRLVLGGGEVPIGAYAEALLDAATARLGPEWRARVEASIASREPNVRLVLAKVELGEADAAIVYRTDAVGVPGVRVVPVPAELDVRARYPIATVSASAHPELAAQFVAFVRSAEGRAVLVARGFEAPSEPSEPSAP